MAYSRDSSGSGWCRRKKFRRHWSHVRMPCIFIGCFIDQAQLDSHDGRTQWEICLARRKVSNMFDFFLTVSRGQFLTKSSPNTVRKRLSKPPREAVCSALSSPCAAGLNVHTDRTRIFYPACEMNTLNWMQSIVILISRDLYQKLMNTNWLSRSLYQKLILLFNNSFDVYWGLQLCTCDLNTMLGLVCTLMNY